MTTMTEKWVQSQIRGLLEARGFQVEKVWGNSINAGFPDLFVGRFWIEVKAPGKKLRPTQVDWFERFVPQGCKAYVCDDPRKLWSIVCAEPGIPGQPEFHSGAGWGESNWRDFAPRVHHRDKMNAALSAFRA